MQKAYAREWNVYNGEHRSNQAERAGMVSGNAGLQNAAKAKKDEFYTQLPDIEAELKHYKDHFKGKRSSATATILSRAIFSSISP